MAEDDQQAKQKKERSPSFPFIALRKAVERAQTLYDKHRREPARLSAVAGSWGYSPKSSGMLQTVAALKQFGLIDDLGSGEDRKVVLTKLGHTIIADARPGVREQSLKDAALFSAIISEYVPRWVPTRPSDAHCISELHLDRGFTEEAARIFLRVFDETVSFAGLAEQDFQLAENLEQPIVEDKFDKRSSASGSIVNLAAQLFSAPKPLKDRLQVSFNSQTLAVTATLETVEEAEQLIATVSAMKLLLPISKISSEASSSEGT